MKNANQVISARVLTLIANGMDAVSALKAVCGAEIVDSMIGNLYDTLRARGLAKRAAADRPHDQWDGGAGPKSAT